LIILVFPTPVERIFDELADPILILIFGISTLIFERDDAIPFSFKVSIYVTVCFYDFEATSAYEFPVFTMLLLLSLSFCTSIFPFTWDAIVSARVILLIYVFFSLCYSISYLITEDD